MAKTVAVILVAVAVRFLGPQIIELVAALNVFARLADIVAAL